MAKDRRQLIYRTLRNLGALPQGHTPDVQEYEAIDNIVDPVIEDLIARDIVYIEDVDAIEDQYFLALAHVVAGAALPEFGLQNDAAMTARAIKGEMDLQKAAATHPTYKPLEIQAY